MKVRAWSDLPFGSHSLHGACILGPDQSVQLCWPQLLSWPRWHRPSPSQVAWVEECAASECMAPCVQLPLSCWPKAWEQWLSFWGSRASGQSMLCWALSTLQQGRVLLLTWRRPWVTDVVLGGPPGPSANREASVHPAWACLCWPCQAGD